MGVFVLAAGLIAGLAIVVVVLVLGLRTGGFTAAGTTTLALGVALIGMSVWSRVKIGPEGIEFETLREQVHAIAESAVTVSEHVDSLTRTVEGSRSQVANLASALRQEAVLDAGTWQPIEDSLAALPDPSLERIRAATATLDHAERVLRPRGDP